MSLDGSTIRPTMFSNRTLSLHPSKMQIEKQAKEKQPRSPGGRLANFLNSLFNQSSSKKKKPKKSNNLSPISEPVKEHEDEQRRKRRSSISHFRTSYAAEDSVNTPTKSYKDLRSYSVAKFFIGDSFIRDDNMDVDYYYGGKQEKVEGTCMVGQSSGGKEEGDGGDESDSSSDLFELKNYDIGPGYDTAGCGSDYCDLPVYETTQLERIKIGSTAISVDQCS